MVEFIQNYGLWILLVGSMFLMHRLGIGCCGGHSHGQRRRPRDRPKGGARITDAEAAVMGEPESSATSSAPPRRKRH